LKERKEICRGRGKVVAFVDLVDDDDDESDDDMNNCI